MKEQITVDKKQYGHGKIVLADRVLSVESVTGDKFRKDMAMQLWAKMFNCIGIEYLHEPNVNIEVEKWCANFKRTEYKQINADFYLRGINVFVLVKSCTFDYDNEKYDEETSKLAFATECNVMVAYTDGKFRLADYLDHKERLLNEKCEDDGKIYLDNHSMLCKCRGCGEFFFTTNTGWYGCRNCGFYDGDNTASLCIRGDVGIREEEPAKAAEVPVEQRTKKNKK